MTPCEQLAFDDVFAGPGSESRGPLELAQVQTAGAFDGVAVLPLPGGRERTNLNHCSRVQPVFGQCVKLIHIRVAQTDGNENYSTFGDEAIIDKNSPKMMNPRMNAETTIRT